MNLLASLVFLILAMIPQFVQSQSIDPTCFRLEGVQLPCISGGLGEKAVSCNGRIVANSEACEEMKCEVPVPITGLRRFYKNVGCKTYSYQCDGQGGGDGCEIGCALQGDQCVNVKTGPDCDKYPNVTCQKSRGSCLEYDRVCEEKSGTCYNDKVSEAGHGLYNQTSKCCSCPQVSVPRCSSC